MNPEELNKKVEVLLNNESFDDAKNLLVSELEKGKFETREELLYLSEIAGLFTDLGNESYDKESVNVGLDILDKNRETFKGIVTETSLDYCIANGKHAIYKIDQRNNPELQGPPTPEVVKRYLSEPKNHYYKAFKSLNLKELDRFGFQVLTNLGNNLNHAGRTIEAIQLFDTVLNQKTDFPQAMGSKADAIRFWMYVCTPPISAALFSVIYINYRESLKYPNVPPEIKERNEAGLKEMEGLIESNGFSINNIDNEVAESFKEKTTHNPYRIFCLDNFLTLSEHAIYCPCRGAKTDNLMIGYDGIVLRGGKIPKMELILNRIKSEFSLARKLFYESALELSNINEDEDKEVLFSDLYEGEVIGLASEKLRTSFRLCFGVLDRIAHGLCYFFDLKENANEDIYFEKFWYNPKNTTRWEKINELSNIHVTALYSIACDLNNRNGEFGLYKEWRNRLEHEILILREEGKSLDLLKVLDDEEFLNSYPVEDFKDNTLHLLQLCRAAIFSFTYAIRQGAITDETPGHVPSIKITPK